MTKPTDNTQWVMVPREPTKEMLESAMARGMPEFSPHQAIYRAMIAAAPTLPKKEPVAYCDPSDPHNSTAFAWPGTMRIAHVHKMPLYTAQPASTTDDDVRRDAERWKSLERFLRNGHIPGPGYGRHIKLVETCPMYGEEREVRDLKSNIDAAIRKASGENNG